jgi:hypothetical protein
MIILDKPKHKRRPVFLRRVVLVMLLGWAFAFWMPFVIVTTGGLSWLNYAIYWSATWAWLVPFTRWLKLRQSFSRFRRAGTFVLLLVLWCMVGVGGMCAARRGILAWDAKHGDACYVVRDHDYTCYVPTVEVPIPEEDLYLPRGGCVISSNWFFTTRIVAEQIPGLPIARVTEFRTRLFFADEIMNWYEADTALSLTR